MGDRIALKTRINHRFKDSMIFIIELKPRPDFWWDVHMNLDGETQCIEKAFTDFLFKCVDYSAETLMRRLSDTCGRGIHPLLEETNGSISTADLAYQTFLAAGNFIDEVKRKADASLLTEVEHKLDGLTMTPLLTPANIAVTLESIWAEDHGFIPVTYESTSNNGPNSFTVECTGDDDCPACRVHKTMVPTAEDAKKVRIELYKKNKEPLEVVIAADSEKFSKGVQEAQSALNALAKSLNNLADQMNKTLQPIFTALVKAFNVFADKASKEFALSYGAEQNAYEEMWKPARECPQCKARLPKKLVERIEAGTHDCPQCHWSKSRCVYCIELLVRDHWGGGHKCPRCSTRYDLEKNEIKSR